MNAHTILIVEDEVVVARDINQQLMRLGYSVVASCRSGEEAIVEADRLRPEVVLMDIHLDGKLDGIEAAEVIRRQTGAAIVFLTAFSGRETIQRAKHVEPFGYIIKPFDEGYLHAVVEMALYKHRAETHLRRAYDEQGTLLRTALDAFFLADWHGRLLDVNESACSMLDYSREELLNLSLSELDAHTEGSPFVSIEAMKHAGPGRFERRQRCKDGRILCVEMSVNYLPHSGGRIFCFTRDITERKASEEALFTLNEELETRVAARTAELDRARQDAERATQAKAAFLTRMSHDLRTPLTGTLGMLELLKQTSLDSEQMEMLIQAMDAAQSPLALADQILDFSSLETGGIGIELAPSSIEGVVEKTCSVLGPLAHKAGVELTLFVDPRIPTVVQADAKRLQQVLLPLVHNAIRFSNPGAKRRQASVRARLGAWNQSESMVEFEVRDNGLGMSEPSVARLFKRFEECDATGPRGEGGTGLGLAIARSLVELMGGDIAVESESGRGSTFRIRLTFPAVVDAPRAEPIASEIAGLSCLVIGADGLSQDLADYLDCAGAAVDLVPDLPSARRRVAAQPQGLWVWIFDIHGEAPQMETLRIIAHDRPGQDTRFVLIGRGRRRTPRQLAPGVTVMDANELTRELFLTSVASAAGRVDLPTATRPIGRKRVPVNAPAREEARVARQLVLVVDESEISREVTIRQLQLLGYAADAAANGREALEMWRSGDYGLLLTDIKMAEVDGYSVAAAIRAQEGDRQHALIIALTSDKVVGGAQQCRDGGIDDYLRKPARLSEVKSVLEKWFPLKQQVLLAPFPKGAAFEQLALN